MKSCLSNILALALSVNISQAATLHIEADGTLFYGDAFAGVTYNTTRWYLNIVVSGAETPSSSYFGNNAKTYDWNRFQASGDLLFGASQWAFHSLVVGSRDYFVSKEYGTILTGYGNDTLTQAPVVFTILVRPTAGLDLATFPGLQPNWSFIAGSLTSVADFNYGIDENGNHDNFSPLLAQGSLTSFTTSPVPEPTAVVWWLGALVLWPRKRCESPESPTTP